jgi:hypothetical protein
MGSCVSVGSAVRSANGDAEEGVEVGTGVGADTGVGLVIVEDECACCR